MIQKVSLQPQIKYQPNRENRENLKKNSQMPQSALLAKSSNKTSFKGNILTDSANAAVGGITWLLQQCNINPMFGVSFIDCLTAIFPRTWVDAKTNGFAAAETFRRESSGLVVNCLIPGFVVLGVAKAIEGIDKLRGKFFNKSNDYQGLSKVWANQDSTENLSKYFSNAKGDTKNYVTGVLGDLEFNSGKNWNKLDLNKDSVKEIISKYVNILDGKIKGKDAKAAMKEIELALLNETKGAEHIRFAQSKKALGQNLNFLLRDMKDLKPFFEKHIGDLSKFEKQITGFVNKKSIIGLLIVIPLAASMQSINRWITKKRSGKEGAPIYKDFVKENTHKKMSGSEKSKFFAQKLLSAGLMVGVAMLSMMKKPSLKMLQFTKNMPSMDQCRWIATSTFASRMLVSEDENELHEVRWRDIATFSSLYFLGDYVAKGVASLFKKFLKVDLLNYTKEAPVMTEGKSKLQHKLQSFVHWVKNTHLKSFDESALISKQAKNLRALCEVSSLGFSMLLLGVLVPWYVRKQTEAKHQKEMEANLNKYHTYPSIFIDRPSARKTFQAFGMLSEANK